MRTDSGNLTVIVPPFGIASPITEINISFRKRQPSFALLNTEDKEYDLKKSEKVLPMFYCLLL